VFNVTTGNLFCPFLHVVVIVTRDEIFCGLFELQDTVIWQVGTNVTEEQTACFI
jgi:hypothetical protein